METSSVTNSTYKTKKVGEKVEVNLKKIDWVEILKIRVMSTSTSIDVLWLTTFYSATHS